MTAEKDQEGKKPRGKLVKIGERVIGNVGGVKLVEKVYRLETGQSVEETLDALKQGLEVTLNDSESDKKS